MEHRIEQDRVRHGENDKQADHDAYRAEDHIDEPRGFLQTEESDRDIEVNKRQDSHKDTRIFTEKEHPVRERNNGVCGAENRKT